MLVAPLGLAAAVSPVMLTEQAVILAGPDGRRAGARYAAGVIVTLLVAVTAILVFGRSLALPRRPHLDASLDVGLGVLLIALAVVLQRRRDRHPPRPAGPTTTRRAQAAFGFGVFSMATNVTTLTLLVPAGKEIAAADVGLAGRVLLVLVLAALASMPASVPVVLTRIAPGPGRRALAAMGELIARYGRVAVVAILAVAGTFFVVRGIVRLFG